VRIAAGSREVPGRKGLLQAMMMMMMKIIIIIIIIIGLKIGGLTIKILCSCTTKGKYTWNNIQ
jgi:hypothetical protein